MSTYKQTKALANMVENGGNMGIALKKAGYSDSMAKNPYKVTRSKGFQDVLVNAGISDEKLALIISKGLDAYQLITVQGQVYNVPDFSEQHKYLQTAIKLKGYDKLAHSAPKLVFINSIPRPSNVIYKEDVV